MEGLERLKSIGAQKIYEETHIPAKHVQSIIHESFEGFTKVQFLGFISILEREYNEDLSELREKGVASFVTVQEGDPEESTVFIVPKRKKKLTYVYILLALAVFAVVAYYKTSPVEEETVVPKVDNSLIADVQKNIVHEDLNESNTTAEDVKSSDVNSSAKNSSTENATDLNATNVPQESVVVKEKKLPESLKFVPKGKLWLGYIDVKTNRHYDKIFRGEFELDAKKDWLIVLGHDNLNLFIDDEKVQLKSTKNLRYLYKDGKIEPITLREFKKLNRGNAW